jgi:uncharacterized protein YeaO (DUF488 family)
VYDPPVPSDGFRVLVDRLWTRGLGKEKARLDDWRPDIAPTNTLRIRFARNPQKWEEFRVRYRNELDASGRMEDLAKPAARARKGTVPLLVGARDRQGNNAAALKEILEERM